MDVLRPDASPHAETPTCSVLTHTASALFSAGANETVIRTIGPVEPVAVPRVRPIDRMT
jgi:hypothetical protein